METDRTVRTVSASGTGPATGEFEVWDGADKQEPAGEVAADSAFIGNVGSRGNLSRLYVYGPRRDSVQN